MSGEPKILLCKLFERTSADGNRCFTGRLGAAKVLVFLDRETEPQCGATAVGKVLLEAGDQDGPRQSASASTPRRSSCRSTPRPTADPPASSDPRRFDDDISDIGA